jgi:hypothetical protein
VLDGLLGASQDQGGLSQTSWGSKPDFAPYVDGSPSNRCNGGICCMEEQRAQQAAPVTWSAQQTLQSRFEVSVPLQTWPVLRSNSNVHSCTDLGRAARRLLQLPISNHAHLLSHPAQSDYDCTGGWVDCHEGTSRAHSEGSLCTWFPRSFVYVDDGPLILAPNAHLLRHNCI